MSIQTLVKIMSVSSQHQVNLVDQSYIDYSIINHFKG